MKIFFVFTVVLLLLGCGTKKTQQENQVQIRMIKDVETLNPVSYGGMIESRIVFAHIYQSLLSVDFEDAQVKPELAEALPETTILDSTSLFTYTLRAEARWPNNSPITANDVLFTLKLMNCPLVNNDSRRASYGFILDFEFDSTSERSFTFLCKGYVEDMNIMTGGLPILPEYVYDPSGILRAYDLKNLKQNYDALKGDHQLKAFAEEFNSLASSHDPSAYVGSDGYVLSAWQTDQYIRLQKKTDWWAEKLRLPHITANPQEITYQIIPDDGSAVLALRNGQIDVMADIPASEFQKLEKDSSFLSQYKLFSPFTYTVNYIGINSRIPKFQSKKTRKALAYLINFEGIIKSIGQQPTSRATSLISPKDKRNYNHKIESYTFDPQKTKQLLEDDGWSYEAGGWHKEINGIKEQLTGNIQYKAGKYEYENIALIFKQAAEKIGIPVSLSPLENSIISNNLRQHNFDFYIRGITGNPFAFNFTPILHRESAAINGMNYTAFGTSESDKLIEAIISEKDKEEQTRFIKDFQSILHDEANLIFLYFNEQKLAVHHRFDNLKISSFYPNYDVSAFELQE